MSNFFYQFRVLEKYLFVVLVAITSDTLSNFNFAPYTGSIYECTLKRLQTADIDQEVKERAISCIGQIICNLGDYLQVKLFLFIVVFPCLILAVFFM